MIEAIIRNEEELRKLVKTDLKKAGKVAQVKLTAKEIQEQTDEFILEDSPPEYPMYAFIDFTISVKRMDVDLLSTCHYLNKEALQKFVDQFDVTTEK